MPTSMYDREQAFEAKFAHDEEARFLMLARRDKLFAQWAANRLRLSEAETDGLVKAVLHIPNGPDHDRALLDHVGHALSASSSDVDLATILRACRHQAIQQFSETPPLYDDHV